IGKDIIGTMTNTLILAFAGGSLSILILIYSSNMPYNKLINLDVLGIELIQGISGSIGIVLAVPITAVIGSYLCKKK
ncbi:MAG: YibE/F family protein, partial [Clostridium celatum]|nr:YibE/F family protein [Clostridium celatum]